MLQSSLTTPTRNPVDANRRALAGQPATGRVADSTGILALTTGISRLLGFVRDILLAQLFGTTMQAEAFVVAFRLPNVLRDLVAEGAMTSAFVPVLSWYRAKRSAEEFWELSHALGTQLLLLLCALGVAGSVAAPLIVRLVAPGFIVEPAKLDLTIRLTRLLFPFITLVGLWAYFMGLLNSLRHFMVPALGSAILNLAMIAGCLWGIRWARPPILAVAISVMIGGVVQWAIQVPVAYRLGWRWRWRRHHAGSREILRLLGPRMVGAAVYQASVFVDTALASLTWIVGPGAVAALYYANRVMQLPLAVFGNAAAQASLPALAEHAAHHHWTAFRATLLSVLSMVGFVIIPSAAGLIALSFPIVQLLFERGAFGRFATQMTAQVLGWYALGLLAYAFSNVLTAAFYAMRETRVPVRLAMEALAANLLLSLALMWPLRLNGLAIAAALSNSLNAYRLLQHMERRLAIPLIRPTAAALGRMTCCAVLMGIGCWVAWRNLAGHGATWVHLLIVVVGSMGFYGGMARLLRIEASSAMWRWIRRHLGLLRGHGHITEASS